MKPRPLLFFFILLLIPFTAYFFRPNFMGFDSYGFLLLTCRQNNAMGAAGVPFSLFSSLPCNILALKVLLFSLCFVSGYFLIKLSTLFSPNQGWRASYLLFLSPVLVLEFAKLENEQFAFPLLFASLYFFFHSLKKSNRNTFFLSLALLVPAGLLWEGAIFYVISYSFNVWMLALISIPALVVYGKQLVGVVVRTAVVAENKALGLVGGPCILTFGLFQAVLNPVLMPQALFFFALGFASYKFWILSVPFLVVGFALLLERLDREWLYQMTAVIAVFFVFGLAQSLWLNPPTQEHEAAVDFALSVSDGNVNNDWGLGYFVMWKGGRTQSYQSLHLQEGFGEGQVVVTEREVSCPSLGIFGKIKVAKC